MALQNAVFRKIKRHGKICTRGDSLDQHINSDSAGSMTMQDAVAKEAGEPPLLAADARYNMETQHGTHRQGLNWGEAPWEQLPRQTQVFNTGQ